jgi:hypothetical protein
MGLQLNEPITYTVTFTSTASPVRVLQALAKAGLSRAPVVAADGTEHVSPWSAECPKCYAQPGEPCMKRRGGRCGLYGWLFCHDVRAKAVGSEWKFGP